MLLELIQGIFSLGFNIVSFGLTVIVAVIVGLSMTAKGRNGLLWGIAAFFFPWLFWVAFLIPAKSPKLDSRIRNHPAFKGRNPVVASIMALSATVAKSDGQVTKEEILLVRQFVQRQFRIGTEELNDYAGAFNYGKEHPEDYIYFTTLLSQYRRHSIVMAVSYLFVGIAMDDGTISDKEDNLVRRILTDMGLHEYEYQSIKQHYSGGYSYGYAGFGGFHGSYAGGGQQYYRQAYQQSGPTTADLRRKYSEVLGVAEDADLSTIKKAYRKLAKEHHPDRMAQDGMPEGYTTYANQRISEINEAYEWLKDAALATA